MYRLLVVLVLLVLVFVAVSIVLRYLSVTNKSTIIYNTSLNTGKQLISFTHETSMVTQTLDAIIGMSPRTKKTYAFNEL